MRREGDRISRRTLLGATGGSLWFNRWGDRPTPASGEQLSGRVFGRARSGSGGAPVDGIPAFPDDPLVVTNFGAQLLAPEGLGWGGWEGSEDLVEALPTLLQFHQDVLDFTVLFPYRGGEPLEHPFQARATEISRRTGLPSTSGWNPTIEIDEGEADSRYGPVLRANAWEYPDGTRVDHPHGLLAETIDGRQHRVAYAPGGFGIPSPFAPGTLDLIAKASLTRYRQGFTGFELDGVDVFNLNGLDFSVWATSAFRAHLESLGTTRLRELGVDDPSSFDVREYLEDNELTPGSDTDPREDPLFREFVAHHHRGIKRLFSNVRERIREAFPRRTQEGRAVFWGNQYTGSLNNPQQANVYASDHLDVINTELSPDVFNASDAAYKYLLAIGRYRKPVMAKGTYTEVSGLRDVGRFDPTRRYPMLSRFQVAESYASGAVLKIPLTSRLPADQTVNHWIQEDGTMEEELRSFVDFLWARGRFFEDVEPDNPVAVVWSLPSRLWRRFPQWNIPPDPWSGPGVNSFIGTTKLLRESQIPYDVLVFGHSQLWDDTDQLGRLMEYGAVVLPNLLSVSDTQLAALRRFLSDGGSLIASGTPPVRGESFEPRDDVDDVFDHENAVVLRDDPGRRYEEAGEPDGSLVAALRDGGIERASTTDDPAVYVNRLIQTDPRRLLVHVVNYDYDAESDSFARKRGLTITLQESDADIEAARYYSPQTVADLEIVREGGSAEVVIPELVEWGFVVFASASDAIDPRVSERSATEAVENARRVVEAARDAGRDGTLDLAVARIRLKEADVALSYSEYGAAKSAATEAVDAANGVEDRSERPGDRARGESERTDARTPGFGVTMAVAGIGSAIVYRLLSGEGETE